MKLHPEEISLWERVYVARVADGRGDYWAAREADEAIESRRERVERSTPPGTPYRY